MTKRLTLLRHAKSSWDNPGLRDCDRPLNARGMRDAPRMGKLLKDQAFYPRVILASDAARARQTIELFAAEIGFPLDEVRYLGDLYHASPSRILSTLERAAANDDDVMLVGHNPGMTELANQLGDARLDNLPTCGIISIRGDVDSWGQLAANPGNVEWCYWPKRDLA